MKFLKIYHAGGDVRYVRLEQVQDIYTYSGPFPDCKTKIEILSKTGEALPTFYIYAEALKLRKKSVRLQTGC